MHVADEILHDAALLPTETPSDAVVVPASPSFPSDARHAALRGTRRALAALPFNKKRSSRKAGHPARDSSPTHNSADLHSPRPHSRGLPSSAAETPRAPSPAPPRPVVSFRSYKQFLFQRNSEIQTAPRTASTDAGMPPAPSAAHGNPLAGPYTSPVSVNQEAPSLGNQFDTPEAPLQELATGGHSRRASAHDSDDGGKEKGVAGGQLREPVHEPLSLRAGRLQSEATIMALETGGSVMSVDPDSMDGSTLPVPTREWQPRRARSANRLSMGAERRPGRHRYTYGNESIASRNSGGGGSESAPAASASPAPRSRMVRQASNVSLVSVGTPLELKGDYNESSFMVNDPEELREGGDKQPRSVLSKLAPYDSVNLRGQGIEAVRDGPGEPQSRAGGEGGRREWVPRHVRSKSKLELGSVRSEGSSFAYSFMYGIGSDHEAAMQAVRREGRRQREERREQQRRLERGDLSPEQGPASGGRWAALAAQGGLGTAAEGSAMHGGSLLDSAMGALSGMELADMVSGVAAVYQEKEDVEEAALGCRHGSKGVVDFGGFRLPVGPSFKQYSFPIGRCFRFSDGMAVPVPLERRL